VNPQSLFRLMKALSLLVLLLLLVSGLYAGYMSIVHWSGIGV